MALEKGLLGNSIRNARLAQSLSQETLAEMVGITPTHLKHIESGHRNPSIEVLISISEILHMSLDNIIFQQDSKVQLKIHEIKNGLSQCTPGELQILLDLLYSLLRNRN